MTLHEKVTEEVNPDKVIGKLFAKKIISVQDYNDLYSVSDTRGRCYKLFGLLHLSSHPETFIHLRDALRNDYPKIVDEIDKQLTLQPIPQPQQPRVSQSAEGMLLWVVSPLLSCVDDTLLNGWICLHSVLD